MEKNIQRSIFAIIFIILTYLLVEIRATSIHIRALTARIDSSPYGEYDTVNKVKVLYVPEERVAEMYQLLKDVHEVLSNHEIRYCMDAGTLLGAVRNSGIIPWDATDMNLSIDIADQGRLEAILSEFKDLGYLVLQDSGYKIVADNGNTLIEEGSDIARYPSIQIAVMHKAGDKIVYYDPGRTEPYAPAFFFKNERYPLKAYKLGELKLFGPADPYGYLDRYYGDWDSFAVIYTNKHGHSGDDFLRVPLEDGLKQPAKSSAPLQNRVKIVNSPIDDMEQFQAPKNVSM